MLCFALFASVMGVLVTADGSTDDAVQQERAKMKGTWRIVSFEINGKQQLTAEQLEKFQLVIDAEGKFTAQIDGHTVNESTTKIDPTKTPKTLDYSFTQGLVKGQTSLAIYELEDDTLTMSAGEPGKDRPTKLSSKDSTLVVHKRKKPAGTTQAQQGSTQAIAAGASEDFTGTREVRLIQGDVGSPKAKTVVVRDKSQIAKLLGTIKLAKKVPCACDHIHHAVFVKDQGELTVSLCDHCFDVGQNTYVMPPAFYKLYLAYTQAGPSHVDAGGQVAFDTYSGYFVSNKFEPDAAESFAVVADQAGFDRVFGTAFVMNDKSHRLPQDAFAKQFVVAVIKRGPTFWEYKVEDVTREQGVVQLRYTVTSKATPNTTFACPLIVSLPKADCQTVVLIENGKEVKKLKVDGQTRDGAGQDLKP